MEKSFAEPPCAHGFSVVRADRFQTGLHDHRGGELVWSSTAVQEVRTPQRVWVAPQEAAIWIPPDQIHRSVTPWAGTEMQVYLDRALCASMPTTCCIVPLSPALRSLLERIVDREDRVPAAGELGAKLCGEVRPCAVPSLPNPLPEVSSVLRPILEAVERDPADERSFADWACFMNTSIESLRQTFHTELGQGFREWRGRMRSLAAAELLALGERSARIATLLGYRSPSIFSATFRRQLGVAPKDFFAALGARSAPVRAHALERTSRAEPVSVQPKQAIPSDEGIDDLIVDAESTSIVGTSYFPRHRHGAGELLWVPQGLLSIGTRDGVWVVPPRQAFWIPEGDEHDARLCDTTVLYYALLERGRGAALPTRCCVMDATPALVGALRALAAVGHGVDARRAEVRVLLGEMRPASVAPLPLPLAPTGTLEPVLNALRDDPAATQSLHTWADYLGVSPRTLARAFRRELGISFASYRRLARLRYGVERLALGDDVTRTAQSAGYRSLSMFVEMFRRTLGTTPARYWHGRSPLRLAERSSAR